METTVAPPARPFALRDIEDLHDADLDNVIADGLADRYDAMMMAAALAQLVGDSGPVAMLAHDLGL
jgi:hypothetical protein